MPIETIPFDAAEYLDTPEAQAAFIVDAFEEGTADDIRRALNTVVRARSISSVANETGLSRQGLYKALGEDEDPKLSTLLGLAKALGFRMTMEPLPVE